MDKSGRVEIFFQDENFFLESRIFFSSREYFFFESRIFLWSREFFHGVENLVIETIILPRVETIFVESRIISSSRIPTISRDFFPRVEICLSSRKFFIESRIPNMPCRQLPPKLSNNMAVCRSVAYVAFLFTVVVLQVADGNVEELERFLLSIQDFISHMEQCTAPGDDRNMKYIYDLGFVESLCGNNRTFSLVFAKVQGFLEIKVLIDDLSHSLRELQNHNRDKLAASFQVSAELPSVPYRERSS